MRATIHGAVVVLDGAMSVRLALLSLGLGALYERTGNLWAAILMHAAFNGVQMILFLTVGM